MMRNHPLWIEIISILAVLLLSIPACYQSTRVYDSTSDPRIDPPVDIPVDRPQDFPLEPRPDFPPDIVPDVAPDIFPDLVIDIIDDIIDDFHVDPTGRLVPEGNGEFFPVDSGHAIHPFVRDLTPAAFSGSVYQLLLIEEEPITSGDRIGAYRLVPGGDYLGTTWVDALAYENENAWICWSGAVFTAVLPTPAVGIRLLTFDEAGNLVWPIEVIGPDPLYIPGDWSGHDASFILCPSEGPIVIDQRRGIGEMDRLHLIRPDGTRERRYFDVGLPWLADNMGDPACTTHGEESACLSWVPLDASGIIFINREGELLYSDALPGSVDFNYNGCSIAATDRGLAVVWTSPGWDWERSRMVYTLFDFQGRIISPLAYSFQVGMGSYGMFAASSGTTVLVVALGQSDPGREVPYVFLLDLDGNPLDTALPLMAEDYPWSGQRGTAVFWEGDAYGVIWPDYDGVWYRRFRVEM